MTQHTSPAKALLPVSLALRIWIAVEVLFGLLSILTISLTPQNTAQHFSWTIQAETTAAVLGGFYFAAATFFVLALFAKHWDNIRVFVPASILFSTVELVSTFLHWDKFAVGTTPFNVWFVSYLLPPPLFIFFYWWHQRRANGVPQPGDETFPPLQRLLMQGLGGVIVAFAALAFFIPAAVIAIMPILLTPLTARALSGWILATGLMLLLAARENDRTRARLISPFFVFLLPALAVEVWRFPAQLNSASPMFYLILVVLLAVFAIGLDMIRGDWRRTLR